MQQFDYNSNLSILKSNQIGVILMTIAVIDTPRDSCDVCFRTFVLMTRFSGVDDNFINKPRLVQDETIRRTKTCKHCCGDRKKWYGGYHGRPKKWSGARRTCRTGDDGLDIW